MTDRPERTLSVYLGDGLKGEFDGYGIKLSTDRDDRQHWVYLEPEVMQSFLDWIKALMLTYPEQTDGWKP